MNDLTVTEQQPIRHAVTSRDPSKRGRVTGKLRTALLSVVHDGAEPYEAARQVGLNPHAMRLALQKRHVLAFLREQREVLRATASAQNIHYAIKMRKDAENEMARLGAMKFIDGPEQSKHSQVVGAPVAGFVIMIAPAPLTADQRQIEAKPLIQHETVSQAIENARCDTLPERAAAEPGRQRRGGGGG